MQPTLKLERSQLTKLNKDIEAFILSTGREAMKVLKDQARLLLRDLIRVTPPFGRHAFSESFAEQRKIGMAAIERDIRKVFVPLRVFVESVVQRNTQLALALSIAGGLQGMNIVSRKQGFSRRNVDMQALTAIFRNMGMDGRIIRTVDPELHEHARGQRGRVRRATAYVVVEERSITQYIKEVQSRVGKAKSGWMKAAIALGLKGIPNWIRDHLTPGVFREQKGSDLSITVGNLIDYAGDFNVRQFDAAVENRRRALRLQLEKILEHQARKVNAA